MYFRLAVVPLDEQMEGFDAEDAPQEDQPAKKSEEVRKPFTFYSGNSYAEDFASSPELVEDVLPTRGIAMVYGPSGKAC